MFFKLETKAIYQGVREGDEIAHCRDIKYSSEHYTSSFKTVIFCNLDHFSFSVFFTQKLQNYKIPNLICGEKGQNLRKF